MDNYLLMGHILTCKVIPKDQVHPELWVGANRKWRPVPRDRVARVAHNKVRFAPLIHHQVGSHQMGYTSASDRRRNGQGRSSAVEAPGAAETQAGGGRNQVRLRVGRIREFCSGTLSPRYPPSMLCFRAERTANPVPRKRSRNLPKRSGPIRCGDVAGFPWELWVLYCGCMGKRLRTLLAVHCGVLVFRPVLCAPTYQSHVVPA